MILISTFSCSFTIATFSWRLSRNKTPDSWVSSKEEKLMVRMPQLSNIWEAGGGLLAGWNIDIGPVLLPNTSIDSPSPCLCHCLPLCPPVSGVWPPLPTAPGEITCSASRPTCCCSPAHLGTLCEAVGLLPFSSSSRNSTALYQPRKQVRCQMRLLRFSLLQVHDFSMAIIYHHIILSFICN